jgi:hypothetical protein
MENKYFTPDIENIHAGYECELLIYDKWEPNTIKPYTALKSVVKCIKDKVIRVPYLTKEQIEAEGWEITDEGVDSRGDKILYKNCRKELNIFNLKYYLIFNEIEKSLNIYMRKSLFDDSIESNLYNGKCKDINTFRKIIKLLEI